MKPLSPERIALLKAADLLEQDGWCQNEFLTVEGYRCVQEAIGVADGWVNSSFDTARRRLASYLGYVDPDGIISWNDHPDRTQDEVVKALRAAAISGL